MLIYLFAGAVFLAELSLISALVALIMRMFRLRWWATFRWLSCLLAGLSFGTIASICCLEISWSSHPYAPTVSFLAGLPMVVALVLVPVCLGGVIGLIGHSVFWGRLSRPELFRTGQGKTDEAENRKPLQDRLKRR